MTVGLAVVLVALLGAGSSTAATLNGVVGARLGAWRATWLFFAVGTALAAALVAATEREVLQAGRLASLSWYALLPGILNVIAVATVIRAVARIGTLHTTAATFSGATVAGLALDHVGAFGLPVLPAEGGRLVGAVLMIAALVLITFAEPARQRSASFLVALGVFGIGAVDNVSWAINADTAAIAGPFTATIAFLGPGALVLPLVFRARGVSMGRAFRIADATPGAYNVLAVAGAAWLLPFVGLHVANATRFVAAIATATALDHLGAFGARRIGATGHRVAASVLLLLGLLISMR